MKKWLDSVLIKEAQNPISLHVYYGICILCVGTYSLVIGAVWLFDSKFQVFIRMPLEIPVLGFLVAWSVIAIVGIFCFAEAVRRKRRQLKRLMRNTCGVFD